MSQFVFALVLGCAVMLSPDLVFGVTAEPYPKGMPEVKLKTIKKDPSAAEGKCIAGDPKPDATTFLKSAGITVTGAKPIELERLAKGVLQIQRLAGEKGFAEIRGAKFKFNDEKGYSEQTSGGILIRRNGKAVDDNVAHLVHELAHYVGNFNGARLYQKYKSTVKSSAPCWVSNYCRYSYSAGSKRNEEFAEVFAAFVTHPDLLLKAGPACLKAYDFFAREVFLESRSVALCDDKNKPTADRLSGIVPLATPSPAK